MTDVLVFLIAAVIVVPLLRRLRSSPILGYLLAGMLIGPHGLGFIEETEAAHTLAEFGIVFLLFMIGLELSIDRLRRLSRFVFGLGALQVVVTGALIGVVAVAAGARPEAGIVIGAGLALSSTAFVLQLLEERGERGTRAGTTAFAVLLFQDLAIVPLLILVPLLGQEGPSLAGALGVAFLKAAAALVAAFFAGRLVLRPAYRIIAATGSAELFVAATLLVILGASWIFSQAGLSMALGAFLAGLLLSETEYRHQVEADIRPFRGILLGLFFITVGMSVDIGFILEEAAAVVLLVAGLLVSKALIAAALCRLYGLQAANSVRVGTLLSQGGEFGFVLFGVAMTAGVLAQAAGQILLAVIAVSMALTPGVVALGARLAARLVGGGELPASSLDHDQERAPRDVLIVGFGRVGQTLGKMLNAAGSTYVALDLDHRLVAGCRARGMPVYYGNAAEVAVLRAAGAGQARAAVITIDQPAAATRAVAALRETYPDLRIFVRAHDLRHRRQLERYGAIAVGPETLEGSLQLGVALLKSLGTEGEKLEGLLGDFREEDYARIQDVVDPDREEEDEPR